MKLKNIKNVEEVKVFERINNQNDFYLIPVEYTENEDKEVESCYENSDGKFIVILKMDKCGVRFLREEDKKILLEDCYKVIDKNNLIGKEEWVKENLKDF